MNRIRTTTCKTLVHLKEHQARHLVHWKNTKQDILYIKRTPSKTSCTLKEHQGQHQSSHEQQQQQNQQQEEEEQQQNLDISLSNFLSHQNHDRLQTKS